MIKHVCSVCGYVYEQISYDYNPNAEKKTPFDELPDDWICPLCGIDKDLFIEK